MKHTRILANTQNSLGYLFQAEEIGDFDSYGRDR